MIVKIRNYMAVSILQAFGRRDLEQGNSEDVKGVDCSIVKLMFLSV